MNQIGQARARGAAARREQSADAEPGHEMTAEKAGGEIARHGGKEQRAEHIQGGRAKPALIEGQATPSKPSGKPRSWSE